MNIFEDVVIHWKGKDYKIPSKKVMGLIDALEGVVTAFEIAEVCKNPPRMSRAFEIALNYAGAKDVNREEIYASLLDPKTSLGPIETVNYLVSMMIPPEHLQAKKPQAKPKKPTTKRKVGAGSSAKRSKPQ